MSDTLPESPRPGATDLSGMGSRPSAEPRADNPHSARAAAPAQESPDTMLEVHPVHGAVRSWRDFLVHIFMIAIGLGLALTLQQTVEYFHHRHQVAETRRALLQEREVNRRTFAAQTRAWHLMVAELQNNLLVFDYLRQHPGTPQERLPGTLLWYASALTFSTAVWDAAHQSGVIALMPPAEIERNSDLYESLDREWDTADQAVIALLGAERYNLSDADPSHMSPEEVGREVDLLLVALEKQWLLGTQMKNLQESFQDFPATVTQTELRQLRHRPDEETQKRLGPAQALSLERLKAAGTELPNP
jgi:hypothetical protein